jgi:hypothetical protein
MLVFAQYQWCCVSQRSVELCYALPTFRDMISSSFETLTYGFVTTQTQRSAVLFEKLILAQLVRKFFALYGTREFLSQMNPFHNITPIYF